MQNYLSVSPWQWAGTNFLAQSLPSSSLGINDFSSIFGVKDSPDSPPHWLHHTSQYSISHSHYIRGEIHNLPSGSLVLPGVRYEDEDEDVRAM